MRRNGWTFISTISLLAVLFLLGTGGGCDKK